MTADEFIQDAIDRGSRDGAAALDPLARAVFLISEAEVERDMGGIDGFVERRDADELRETAAAFALVSAGAIAEELETIADSLSDPGQDRIERLGDLISQRVGYDYEAIRTAVERHLRQPQGDRPS